MEEETPDVQEWESAQNQLTRTWFDSSPAKACADRLMAAMPRIESNEFPVFSGGRWFRKRTPQDQKMPIVEVADALDGAWRIIVDLNQRSEEHTSELQSLMRISYAVFCLTKQNTITHTASFSTI